MRLFNKNAIRNKLQHYKTQVSELFMKKKKAEESRKVDEASWESMDASDPPAHISKSVEDKVLH
jgi:hypothetical protein